MGSAFDSKVSPNKYEREFLNWERKYYYKNSVDTERGFLSRWLNAKKTKNETKISNSNLTLHTGTLDLPFLKASKKQKHYLFCDTTWNLWASYSMSMNGYSKKILIDAEKLERKAYHQMEHIFPISEYVKENLIAHYDINPKKITVVGTGLGVIKPYFGLKNYSNGKILFVAKERYEDKGGFLVLDAFKIALKSNPNLELTIVGQNDFTEKINMPNVNTYGIVPIEILQEFFNESSIFLMPAKNEPWGLVYLEALACKIPIVGFSRNSFPEISGNGVYGFSLNEDNPEELAKILLNAFSNPSKLAEIGLKAQNYCLDKYSWNNTVSKIIRTIENAEK